MCRFYLLVAVLVAVLSTTGMFHFHAQAYSPEAGKAWLLRHFPNARTMNCGDN